MSALIFISSVLLLCYAFFVGKFAYVSKKKEIDANHAMVEVSILVVFRDEETRIEKLIESLGRQDYSHASIELLLFDDDSTDRSADLLRRILPSVGFPSTVFSGKELNISGKKAALSFLNERAKGGILLYTDGDVEVPGNWISSIMTNFENPDVQMVCGGVLFSNTQTLFEKLSALEFAAMIQTSLGAISKQFPFMCNAANMAVRKSALLDIYTKKGESLSSGDDVFLLQVICEKFGSKAIVADFNAPVMTESPRTLKDFFRQRIRWAGKSSKSFWSNSFTIALLVFSISMWMVLLPILSVFIKQAFVLFLVLFFLKWILDFWVLKKFRDNFGLFKGVLGLSVLLSLVYPWYVVVTALLSLKSTYLWKGRIVK